jgi:uncharacterized membrane protein YtjA (UPF0391 family)
VLVPVGPHDQATRTFIVIFFTFNPILCQIRKNVNLALRKTLSCGNPQLRAARPYRYSWMERLPVRSLHGQAASPLSRRCSMLSWSVTFLIIALVAAVLGFSGIAGAAAGIAKLLFGVFLVIFIVSLFFGRRAV